MTIYDQLKKSDGAQGIADKSAIVAGDKFVVVDSEDSDQLKRVPRNDMPGAQPRLISNTAVKQALTASSTQYLVFDVSDMTNSVEFQFEGIQPTIDGGRLEMQVKVGGVWQVTNYVYECNYVPDNQTAPFDEGLNSTTEAHTTSMRFSGSIGNAATEGLSGRILLDNPSNTSLYKNYSGEVAYTSTAGDSFIFNIGGAYQGGGGAIEEVRFFMSTGFIASGTIRMIDPTGGGSMTPMMASAKYQLPASTSIASAAWGDLSALASTKLYDDDGVIDANGIFTAPHSGVYAFGARLFLNSGGGWNAGEALGVRIAISTDGGSTYPTVESMAYAPAQTTNAFNYQTSGSLQRQLNAGDKVKFEYLQQSGGAINTTSTPQSGIEVFEIPSSVSTLDPAVRAKWDSNYSYSKGDITVKNVRTYQSLTDNNVGNDPTSDTTNWTVLPVMNYSDAVARFAPAGNVTLNPSVWTKISMGATFTASSAFSLSGGNVVCQKAGRFIVECYGQYNASGGYYADMRIVVNSVVQDYGQRGKISTDFRSDYNVFVLDLAVGDTVWFEMLTFPGSVMNTGSKLSFYEISTGAQTVLASPVKYSFTADKTIPNNTWTILDFDTKDYDDDDLVTTGASWKYTADHDCTVAIIARAFTVTHSFTDGEAVQIALYKNGVSDTPLDYKECESAETERIAVNGGTTIDLVSGDYIDVRCLQVTGGDLDLDFGSIDIFEVPTSTSVPAPAVRDKWSSVWVYANGDITTSGGRSYKSLSDDNVGNDPQTDTTNWALLPEVATGDYSYVTMSTNQTNPTAGTIVQFDTKQTGNIPFDSSTYKWTLRGGRTYHLAAYIRTFGHSGTDSITCTWANASGDIGSDSLTRAGIATSQATNVLIAGGIYTPTNDEDVWVKVDTNSSGTVDVNSFSYVMIHQIGVGAYVPLMAPARYTRSTSLSLPAATETLFDCNTKVYDDDGVVTTGATTWEFTAPHDGTYRFKAFCLIGATDNLDVGEAVDFRLEKYVSSWTDYAQLDRQQMTASPTSFYLPLEGSCEVQLNAGEKVRAWINPANVTETISTLASALHNYIEITEVQTSISVPKPAMFHAFAETNTALALTADVTDVVFEDIESDPHGIINVSNGRITPGVDGVIKITVNVDMSGIGQPRPKLFKNGTLEKNGSDTNGGEPNNVSFMVPCTNTDYFTIRNGANATLDGVAASNWIAVEVVQPEG
jgi:hypothetical protein